jgi:hypothetical protein
MIGTSVTLSKREILDLEIIKEHFDISISSAIRVALKFAEQVDLTVFISEHEKGEIKDTIHCSFSQDNYNTIELLAEMYNVSRSKIVGACIKQFVTTIE